MKSKLVAGVLMLAVLGGVTGLSSADARTPHAHTLVKHKGLKHKHKKHKGKHKGHRHHPASAAISRG